jgi:MYXO-CTERM domain-containing protein
MKPPTKVLLCVASLWATFAFGDAMPACPPGEKVVINPVAPGAFHHAGGNCVKDPDYKPTPDSPKPTPEPSKAERKTSGCAVSPASPAAGFWALALGLLALHQRRSRGSNRA